MWQLLNIFSIKTDLKLLLILQARKQMEQTEMIMIFIIITWQIASYMVRKDERPYGVSKLKSPRSAPVAALRSPLVSAPTPSRIPQNIYTEVVLHWLTSQLQTKLANKLQTHKISEQWQNQNIKPLQLDRQTEHLHNFKSTSGALRSTQPSLTRWRRKPSSELNRRVNRRNAWEHWPH